MKYDCVNKINFLSILSFISLCKSGSCYMFNYNPVARWMQFHASVSVVSSGWSVTTDSKVPNAQILGQN